MDTLYQKLQNLNNEEEESINNIISKNPFALDISDQDVQEVGDYFLPFSTGFEIECFKDFHFNAEVFRNIPNILDFSYGEYEQRFRIPSGIEGLRCLYAITQALKTNSVLNPLSGIHYHIDFTDSYEFITEKIVEKNKDWILKELEFWKYKGKFNHKNITFTTSHNWLRFQESFKTLEFRIGEMTFEYNILFRRITHANHIVAQFKEDVLKEYLKSADFKLLDTETIQETLKTRTKFI